MPRTRFLSAEERMLRIKRLISASGLSMWEFADKHKFHYITLRRLCEQQRDPPVSTIIRLATALGVSAGFLIDRKEVK